MIVKRLAAVFACLTLLCLTATSAQAAGEESVGVLNTAPRSWLTETPFITQCELGCVAADAVRAYTAADISLVNVGDIRNDLNQGVVTQKDIENVFAADRPLCVATVTPAELYAILENAVSRVEVDPKSEQIVSGTETFDGFCQVSGFSFRYDASAPAGERIMLITLDDGRELSVDDHETYLTLGAAEFMLDGSYGFPPTEYRSVEGTLSTALTSYVASRSDLPEGETERIYIAGARQNAIVGMFPKGALVIGVGLLAAFLAFTRLRSRAREEDPYPEGE